ncbi:MAG: hypothetical protein VX733_01900 [Candidatus Latescibacterota bacterium]|nr:hypothetical protein [Candidatus Latescibacterota bacterium]
MDSIAKVLREREKRYHDETEYTAWSSNVRGGFHDPARFGIAEFVQ